MVAALIAGLLLLTGPKLMAQASAIDGQELEEIVLSTEALDLELRHGKRKTSGKAVESRISVPVRRALNEWADVASALGLSVVVPKDADALILGTATTKELGHLSEVVDETWEFVADLTPLDDAEPAPATILFVFDEDGMEGESWAGVIDELVRRNELVASAAEPLKRSPGPLMLRGLPGFLQPTFDMAGDASAGDDEFRLDNEVAHKLAQCILKSRFGEVPETIRWGIGFLVEQRQFQSIYQMNATGFVAAKDHFDWPAKTRDKIVEMSKKKDWSVSRHVGAKSAAGRAETPQMITWAALDYLYKNDADALRGMLAELASLHDEAAGWRTSQQHYLGDEERTAKLLVDRMDGIDAKKLAKHLRRLK